MAAVDERLGEVDLAALVQVTSERGEDPIENSFALPLLETLEARRVRRIPTRHVGPRCAGPQHPEDPVKNVARISPRTPALLRCAFVLGSRHELLDRVPLLVCQIHPEGTNTFCARWKYRRERWSDLDRLRHEGLRNEL